MPEPLLFSAAVRSWAFVELPLVELSKFRPMLRERGLNDLHIFDRAPWETLDREGIISPVAYALHGFWSHDVMGCLEDGDLRIREESGFIGWEELDEAARAAHGGVGNVQILYHHWQVFAVAELQRLWSVSTPWYALGDGYDRFAALRHECAAEGSLPSRDLLLKQVKEWRALELQLVRVQNTLWPFENGGPGRSRWIGGPVNGLTEDAATWAREQHRDADYAAIAEECDLDGDSLRARYEELAYIGGNLDPNIGIFGLLDQIRRSRIERTTGPARLALDYYDAARMFRHWYLLATKDTEAIPDIDDLRGALGPEIKRRRYGTTDLRANRAILPQLLEDYGIYPWRVHLVVEGDSELALIRALLDRGHGRSFERLGILTTDIGGADVPANAERLLTDFRRYANYFLLVFDNEGRAAKIVEILQRTEVIEGVGDKQRAALRSQLVAAAKSITDPEARKQALQAARNGANRELDSRPGAAPEFQLWKDNLEADNFTEQELCSVATDLMRAQLNTADAITPSDLEAARAEHPNKGVASMLTILAARRGVTISKPSLAEALAEYALEHPEHLQERRPILELVEHLIRLTGASRDLRGRLRS